MDEFQAKFGRTAEGSVRQGEEVVPEAWSPAPEEDPDKWAPGRDPPTQPKRFWVHYSEVGVLDLDAALARIIRGPERRLSVERATRLSDYSGVDTQGLLTVRRIAAAARIEASFVELEGF